MTASLSHHDYTFRDYLEFERDSEIKHEFDAGEILAMSGGTARHSALAARMIIAHAQSPASTCGGVSHTYLARSANGGAAFTSWCYGQLHAERAVEEHDCLARLAAGV